mmetsp:Transcript_4705/g.6247  ORF Transcript_4705/g.6247 Transcript_4705/m.6247 type:complete len:92 (-) Transcript_4705:1060-1335(-)
MEAVSFWGGYSGHEKKVLRRCSRGGRCWSHADQEAPPGCSSMKPAQYYAPLRRLPKLPYDIPEIFLLYLLSGATPTSDSLHLFSAFSHSSS